MSILSYGVRSAEDWLERMTEAVDIAFGDQCVAEGSPIGRRVSERLAGPRPSAAPSPDWRQTKNVSVQPKD